MHICMKRILYHNNLWWLKTSLCWIAIFHHFRGKFLMEFPEFMDFKISLNIYLKLWNFTIFGMEKLILWFWVDELMECGGVLEFRSDSISLIKFGCVVICPRKKLIIQMKNGRKTLISNIIFIHLMRVSYLGYFNE